MFSTKSDVANTPTLLARLRSEQQLLVPVTPEPQLRFFAKHSDWFIYGTKAFFYEGPERIPAAEWRQQVVRDQHVPFGTNTSDLLKTLS